MKEATFICTCCHEEYPMSQYQEASGDPVCPSCLEEETVICSSCGARIWKDDNAGDDDTPLCQRCYDRYYTICDHCGAVIPYEDVRYASSDEDEEFPLCDDCFTHTAHNPYSIQDYYYKPSPIFYGEGPRFFGVELEIDEAGESDRNARELLEIANGHE